MSDRLLPLLVEPGELEAALGTDGLLVVDASDGPTYQRGHVPGAVLLDFAGLLSGVPPATGQIAPDGNLSSVLSAIGLGPASHVVAYDNSGNGRASRLLWTLDVIGHGAFSLLNGGLAAWAGEGHGLETTVNAPAPSGYTATATASAIAGKQYILDHLDDGDVVIFDVRSPAEYSGEDVRAARGGHIPGAVNMNWTDVIDQTRNMRFKPEAELRAMLDGLGITPGKEVIVHCQTHHRSAHTYMVLKSLGFEKIRGYDGSWSEWGNDADTPTET